MLRQEIPAGMLSGISAFNHEWQGKILQSGLILACELLEFCHSVSNLCSNGTEIQPETSEIVPLPSERTWLIFLQHPNLFVGCCGEGNLWISTDIYRYLQISTDTVSLGDFHCQVRVLQGAQKLGLPKKNMGGDVIRVEKEINSESMRNCGCLGIMWRIHSLEHTHICSCRCAWI
jgi:hypothetical protein